MKLKLFRRTADLPSFDDEPDEVPTVPDLRLPAGFRDDAEAELQALIERAQRDVKEAQQARVEVTRVNLSLEASSLRLDELEQLLDGLISTMSTGLVLSPGCGVELIGQAKQTGASTCFIAWSGFDDDERVHAAFRAGAQFFVSKCELDRLHAAIRFGLGYKNPRGVTGRKREVLELIGRDFSDEEIAERLGLTKNTVHTYVERLKSELGVERRRQLIDAVHFSGIVTKPE